MELVNDEFFVRSKAYAHAVAMLLFPVEKKVEEEGWPMRKENFVIGLANVPPVVPKITTPLTIRMSDPIAYILLLEWLEGWLDGWLQWKKSDELSDGWDSSSF